MPETPKPHLDNQRQLSISDERHADLLARVHRSLEASALIEAEFLATHPQYEPIPHCGDYRLKPRKRK